MSGPHVEVAQGLSYSDIWTQDALSWTVEYGVSALLWTVE